MSEGVYDLKRFYRKAQKELGLEGWSSDIRWLDAMTYGEYVRSLGGNEGDGDYSFACTDLSTGNMAYKNIKIRMRIGGCSSQEDAENTIVHELLHILFWYGHDGENYHVTVLEEQAMCTIDSIVADGIRRRMEKK